MFRRPAYLFASGQVVLHELELVPVETHKRRYGIVVAIHVYTRIGAILHSVAGRGYISIRPNLTRGENGGSRLTSHMATHIRASP